MKSTELIFWVLLGVVFYTHIGYGVILYIAVKIKELFIKVTQLPEYSDFPEVTLLIAAYNEEEIVAEKMDNTNALIYPSEKLKVVWVTDGSDDKTNELLNEYSGVRVLFQPERKGKTAAINRAVPLIETPLIIFTDANTMLNRAAVTEIVKAFRDVRVGCVAGEKRVSVSRVSGASAGGEGIYWRYESKLKELDSRLYSAVGAAGELFAIRRELFEQMSPDTLLDDFVMSVKIAMKGFKIQYCKEAYALEEGSLNMREEQKRKVRISAGGIQSIIKLLPLLNVFRYGILSFQYISHRVLRWSVTPLFLFALLPLNAVLAINTGERLYVLLMAAQLMFYLIALWGAINRERNIKYKFLFIPYYFLFMHLSVIKGFFYLIKRGRGDGSWEKAKRLPV